MIIRQWDHRTADGLAFYKRYSSSGYYIRKEGTNEIYTEAIDAETSAYTYIETEQLIPGRIRTGITESIDPLELQGQDAYLRGVNEA